jgi:hypothetical protein
VVNWLKTQLIQQTNTKPIARPVLLTTHPRQPTSATLRPACQIQPFLLLLRLGHYTWGDEWD